MLTKRNFEIIRPKDMDSILRIKTKLLSIKNESLEIFQQRSRGKGSHLS